MLEAKVENFSSSKLVSSFNHSLTYIHTLIICFSHSLFALSQASVCNGHSKELEKLHEYWLVIQFQQASLLGWVGFKIYLYVPWQYHDYRCNTSEWRWQLNTGRGSTSTTCWNIFSDKKVTGEKWHYILENHIKSQACPQVIWGKMIWLQSLNHLMQKRLFDAQWLSLI